MPTICVFDKSIQYDVTESENTTEPRFDVDIYGVRIILPEGSDSEAEEIANENAQWILENGVNTRAIGSGHRRERPTRVSHSLGSRRR